MREASPGCSASRYLDLVGLHPWGEKKKSKAPRQLHFLIAPQDVAKKGARWTRRADNTNTIAANQTLSPDKALCSCPDSYGRSLCFSWWEPSCPLTNALRHTASPALRRACNVCLDTLATARPLPQALLGFPDSSQKTIPHKTKTYSCCQQELPSLPACKQQRGNLESAFQRV